VKAVAEIYGGDGDEERRWIMNEIVDPRYLRISAISSAFANYGNIPQHILDRAAARGECVHRLIFDYMNDIVIPKDRFEFMGDDLNGYFDSFLKFWDPYEKSRVDILLQEERFYNDTNMTTGEPDLLVQENKHVTLIDWKCTSAVGKHWILQAGGYCDLIEKQNRLPDIDKILFVKLNKEGSFPIVTEYERDQAVGYFDMALEMYKMFHLDKKHNLENE
jgi:hypothetical protein